MQVSEERQLQVLLLLPRIFYEWSSVLDVNHHHPKMEDHREPMKKNEVILWQLLEHLIYLF